MPSGKSIYLRDKVLDHVHGIATYTAPATIYIALSSNPWLASATGTSIAASEPTVGGYARVSVSNSSTGWSTSSGGASSNAALIQFPACTADWGTMVAFYVVDASTGGNILYGGDLYVPKAVLVGDTAKFEAGQLNIQET